MDKSKLIKELGMKQTEPIYRHKIYYSNKSHLKEFAIVDNEIVNVGDFEWQEVSEFVDRAIKEYHRQKDRERMMTLTFEDFKILKDIQKNNFIVEKVENKLGEEIAFNYIKGDFTNGFTQYRLICTFSKEYGLGNCECSDHETYGSRSVMYDDVLETVKEHRQA